MRFLPPKLSNITARVRTHAAQGNWVLTNHALTRMRQRDIDAAEVRKVLMTGKHYPGKDKWDEENLVWKYAYAGRVDQRRIRFALTFVQKLLILTVINEGYYYEK